MRDQRACGLREVRNIDTRNPDIGISMIVYTKWCYNILMNRTFEWDDAKAKSNLSKHGIAFDEASLVFNDPLHKSRQDRIVDGEERWQTIGMVYGCLLVLVAHTARFEEAGIEVIRIISARRATKHERVQYENDQN